MAPRKPSSSAQGAARRVALNQYAPPAAKRQAKPAVQGPPSAASLARGKQAFQNFTLSKFSNGSRPPNVVAAGQTTADVQRQVIAAHINTLQNTDAPPRALTIAFPSNALRKLLPSYNKQAGTIDLSEVLRLVAQNMRGTEFYASGDPTLNRLTIDSRVKGIIADVTRENK